MPLIQTLDHPSGFTITDAYWRICSVVINYHAKHMEVEIRAFKDAAAFQNQLQPLGARTYRFAKEPYEEGGESIPSALPWFQDDLNMLDDHIEDWLLTTAYFTGATKV